MELTEPDLSRAERFEQQILNLLSRQARRVPLPVFICTCMIAGMAWPSIPAHYLISWLVLVLVVLAVRWRILGRISDHTRISIEKRVRIAVTLSAINGCVHGLSLLFFPFMPLFECAVQSMILIGMSAGAVVTTAGKSSILLAYAFPTLAVLAGSWAFGSNFADTGWIHWTMALMILVFAYILDAVTRDMGRVLRESFEIRTERAALNRELRAALDIAEAASQSKTRFLASASHDLRQPLQALALFAASLAMRQLDKGSKEIAEHMNTALNDLTSELDALLDISKLDAGVVVPEPTEVDLPALIRRACENFRPSAEIKNLKLQFDAAAPVFVRTDRKLFDRVLRNLIENAIKYTDAGYVHIGMTIEEGRVRVAVTDSGCGIPEHERAHVFEEFYQANNPERDRKRGLGLGLAIVKRLVDLLDIPIELLPGPESGTQFALRLEIVSNAIVAPCVAARALPESFDLCVLIVDDEEEIRIGMRTLLEQLGCTVMLASATDEAVLLARSGCPDAVIADFRLRGTDNGLIAILAVRAVTPAVHAILMTGESSPGRLREAQNANVSILHKPVIAEVLKQELCKVSKEYRRRA